MARFLTLLRYNFPKNLIEREFDLVTVKHHMGHQRLDSTACFTKPSMRDLEIAVAMQELEEL